MVSEETTQRFLLPYQLNPCSGFFNHYCTRAKKYLLSIIILMRCITAQHSKTDHQGTDGFSTTVCHLIKG